MPTLSLRGQKRATGNRLVAHPSSGSGLIVSASIVGSGEIILTASLGAAVGFGMLWWVLYRVGASHCSGRVDPLCGR